LELAYAALRHHSSSGAPYAPLHFPTNMNARTSRQAGGSMAIEKCINDFDVNEVIFEEGSTGRDLFVVLDGRVDIARISGSSRNGHRHARQRRVLRRDGGDRRLVARGNRVRRGPEHHGDADQSCPLSVARAAVGHSAAVRRAGHAVEFEPIMRSVRDLNKRDDG
jgi:hypothetical protein